MLITAASGLITVTYNPTSVGVAAAANTITLTPWVRNAAAGAGQSLAAAIAAGNSGAIDWGCASATNASATAAGITVGAAGNGGQTVWVADRRSRDHDLLQLYGMFDLLRVCGGKG